MKERWWLGAVALTAALALALAGSGCNEAICGSMVSKCLLTQSCKCERKESSCPCCKDCYNCLSYLWSECCSCVEMCNQTTPTVPRNSYVNDFSEPVTSLFQSLTESPDIKDRWMAFTFPFDLDLSQFAAKSDVKMSMISEEQNTISVKSKHVFTENCTVAYWDQCMSQAKCEHSCTSMGASKVRWFHDGCCECVGDKCINYGINESRCKECPDTEEMKISEQEQTYGEDEEEDEEEEEDTQQNQNSITT